VSRKSSTDRLLTTSIRVTLQQRLDPLPRMSDVCHWSSKAVNPGVFVSDMGLSMDLLGLLESTSKETLHEARLNADATSALFRCDRLEMFQSIHLVRHRIYDLDLMSVLATDEASVRRIYEDGSVKRYYSPSECPQNLDETGGFSVRRFQD
jgi:hypothetical protein